MNNKGVVVYYAGIAIIMFLWMFIQPVYFPIAPPMDIILGIGIIAGWFFVCKSSFPAGVMRKCNNCGHEYKPEDVPSNITAIEQCPACPEEEDNVQEHAE